VISVYGVELTAFALERKAELVFCYWLFKRLLALRLPILDVPASNLIPKFLMVVLSPPRECLKQASTGVSAPLSVRYCRKDPIQHYTRSAVDNVSLNKTRTCCSKAVV
jgi:hypothetical protein